MKKNISTWEFHCDRLQSLNERITSNSNLQDIKDALSSKDYKVPICNEDTWISTIVEFRKNETKLYISPGKPDSTEYITIVFYLNNGAPEEIRTPDPLLRRQLLYPAELQALGRGSKIRTYDHSLPKRVRYQTALYPVDANIKDNRINKQSSCA